MTEERLKELEHAAHANGRASITQDDALELVAEVRRLRILFGMVRDEAQNLYGLSVLIPSGTMSSFMVYAEKALEP